MAFIYIVQILGNDTSDHKSSTAGLLKFCTYGYITAL